MRQIPKLILNIHQNNSGEAVIDIDGAIGETNYEKEDSSNTSAEIKSKLREISDISASKIIVNINSPGGLVNDGLAIHDALAQHPAQIHTKVYGMTASAATIIAQAGDVREMSSNALYLVHRAWGLALGNQNDMREMIDTLEKIDQRIASLYARRSGKNTRSFLELMDANSGSGRFLDSEEAKSFGLIDSEFEPMKAAASINQDMLNALGVTLPEGSKINVSNSADVEEQSLELFKLKYG